MTFNFGNTIVHHVAEQPGGLSSGTSTNLENLLHSDKVSPKFPSIASLSCPTNFNGSLLPRGLNISTLSRGLPRRCRGKEPACQCRRCRRQRFDPWVRKIPWSGKWQPTPVFLPGEFHGQRSLVGYSPQSRRELDMTEHMHAHTSDLEVKAFHDVAGPSVQPFVHLWTPCSSGFASSLPHHAMPVQFPGAQSAFPTSALSVLTSPTCSTH